MPPIADLLHGKVWLTEDVAAWIVEHREPRRSDDPDEPATEALRLVMKSEGLDAVDAANEIARAQVHAILSLRTDGDHRSGRGKAG